MQQDRLVRMCKALGNPNRFRLFAEIRRAGKAAFPEGTHRCSLQQIVKRLTIGAPTVSHHLKELVNAGLVATEREGKFVHCQINQDAVSELGRFFTEETRE